MLYKDKQIKELYDLKHRHDKNDDWVDYEDVLLKKSLSPYLYKNDKMNDFLNNIQKITVLLFDNNNIIKNFKNYIVDKHYFKHSR